MLQPPSPPPQGNMSRKVPDLESTVPIGGMAFTAQKPVKKFSRRKSTPKERAGSPSSHEVSEDGKKRGRGHIHHYLFSIPESRAIRKKIAFESIPTKHHESLKDMIEAENLQQKQQLEGSPPPEVASPALPMNDGLPTKGGLPEETVKADAEMTVENLLIQYENIFEDRTLEDGNMTVSELVSLYDSNTNPPSKSQKNNCQNEEVSTFDQAVIVYELDKVKPSRDNVSPAGDNEYLLDVMESQPLQPTPSAARAKADFPNENQQPKWNGAVKLFGSVNKNNDPQPGLPLEMAPQNIHTSFDEEFPPLSHDPRSKRTGGLDIP